MALTKCPECHKDVSDTAETCPHCGYRLKRVTPKPTTTYYSNRASNIVERDHNMKHVGGIIGGIIGIIAGIVFFACCGLPEVKAYSEIRTVLILGGILMLIVGIIAIAYSAYRLRNY